MTERERIKCLIDEAIRLQEEKCCRCSIGNIAQFLVDNGVIAPPYEIGDKVFAVDYDSRAIAPAVVECIHFYGDEFFWATVKFDGERRMQIRTDCLHETASEAARFYKGVENK